MSTSSVTFATDISVVALRTEFMESPMGVESLKPLLSWQIRANRRDVRQRAYRIEVASTLERLETGNPDLWDSGRVASDGSVGIPYGGAVLSSRQCCFWRVQIWDENGVVSAPSAVARWEMGLLRPGDWSAQWLAAETKSMREDRGTEFRSIRGRIGPSGETTKFRLNFSLETTAAVTLYITGNGNLDVWIDGQTVATFPLDFQAFGQGAPKELTIPLDAGRHVLAIALGEPRLYIARLGSSPGGEIAPFLRIQSRDGTVRRLSFTGWKTGLASVEGWQNLDFDDTSWPEAEPVSQSRPLPWPRQSAILLRRAFSTTKPLLRARVYATALGAYELYINGSRVGDALLAPESTDFGKRALYRVYDVTKKILAEDNVIGTVVGDGWYGSYMCVVGRYPWGPPPRRMLVQLELTYTDGSREVFESGPDWQVSTSPIIFSEMYDGECYDARQEQAGWSSPGFDASHWEKAEPASMPHIALTCQIAPPIKREKTLRARNITEPHPGVFVFDFGQNFAGWCRLQVKGAAGTVIELRFAELLTSSGEIDQSNLGDAKATDTYILKGDPAGEIFEPHFTYHGFRYVRVVGLPSIPTPETLQGIVIHSDVPITGTLRIDNPVIQALWHNTLWSQRSNFMGIPTDCPQRDERLGWMGDANVFWDAAAFNMDVAAFTHRFMSDVRDAQAENGAFPDFAPAPFRYPDGMFSGGAPDTQSSSNEVGAAAGWADGGVILPWTVWWRYGDTGIIEENWQAMVRYIEFIAMANSDFICRNGRGADYGDWLSLDGKNSADPTTPKELVATAEWAHSVACMIEMADAIGHRVETALYRMQWTNIASSFVRNFVKPDGFVGNGSQTGYILALRYGLLPEELRAVAAAKLAEDIRRRGTLLSTGFLGTPASLDVLADAGYHELLYSLLLRTEFPSWGHMVAEGATTIWERWDADRVAQTDNSLNHYALGGICGFLFRRIAAISPLEPGFRRIEVHPVLDPRVKRGGAQYDSVRGRISTSWEQRESDGFTLDLTVPPNATARVYLPAEKAANITESGEPLSHNACVTLESWVDKQAILNVPSGDYHFAVI